MEAGVKIALLADADALRRMAATAAGNDAPALPLEVLDELDDSCGHFGVVIEGYEPSDKVPERMALKFWLLRFRGADDPIVLPMVSPWTEHEENCASAATLREEYFRLVNDIYRTARAAYDQIQREGLEEIERLTGGGAD